LPFIEDAGRGMSWGRIVHGILEALAREADVDLELTAENLLKEEERPLSEKDSLIAPDRGVAASKLWKRMQLSAEKLLEVPFSLRIEGEEPSRIVSGAIDLAFKESDGWVIADYKTDKVGGRLEGLVKYYKPQVMMYKISGRRCPVRR
jgi:ATP-dependent helicase/nuclease subunit A